MSKQFAIFGAGLSAQAARRLAEAKGLSVVLIDEAGEGDQATFEASDLERFHNCSLIYICCSTFWRRSISVCLLRCSACSTIILSFSCCSASCLFRQSPSGGLLEDLFRVEP